jgi:hypothetical protein
MGAWRYTSTIIALGTRWEWAAPRPDRLTSKEGTPGIGGWMGPRSVLDAMENRKIQSLPGIEFGRHARIPSLYQLRLLTK